LILPSANGKFVRFRQAWSNLGNPLRFKL
jgi:hypothetical protein